MIYDCLFERSDSVLNPFEMLYDYHFEMTNVYPFKMSNAVLCSFRYDI